jgi:hypothetical protein
VRALFSAGLGIAGVVAAFLATTFTHVAPARANEAELLGGDARPLSDDGYVPGRATEIVVRITNDRAPVSGRVEVVALGRGHWSYGDGPIVERRPLTLQSGVTVAHIPVLADHEYSVRFVSDDDRLLWQRRVIMWSSGRSAMVVRDDIGGEVPMADPQGWIAQPILLRALPRTAHGYDGAGLLVLRARTLERAEEEACAPLSGWMRDGGMLVVVTEDSAPRETVVARCGIGEVTNEARAFGAGRVVSVPIGRLSQSSTMVELKARSAPRPMRPSTQDLVIIDRPTYATRGALAALVLVAFGIAAGPVVFFRTRRRGKKSRFLPILAGSSFAGFGAMVGIGCAFGPKPHTETSIIRDFESGVTTGRIVQTRAFHRPTGVVHTNRALPGSLLGDGSDDLHGAFEVERDGTLVLNRKEPRFEDYVYVVETSSDRLPGPITITCSNSTCTIDNASGAPLERAQLYVTARGVYDVGTCGRTTTVNLDDVSRRKDLLYTGVPARWFSHNGASVALAGWQPRDGTPSMIAVACVTGCEAAR